HNHSISIHVAFQFAASRFAPFCSLFNHSRQCHLLNSHKRTPALFSTPTHPLSLRRGELMSALKNPFPPLPSLPADRLIRRDQSTVDTLPQTVSYRCTGGPYRGCRFVFRSVNPYASDESSVTVGVSIFDDSAVVDGNSNHTGAAEMLHSS